MAEWVQVLTPLCTLSTDDDVIADDENNDEWVVFSTFIWLIYVTCNMIKRQSLVGLTHLYSAIIEYRIKCDLGLGKAKI